WYEERSRKDVQSQVPKFSLCCMQGKVELPRINHPLEILDTLLHNRDERSTHFCNNIRSYNMMFAFTSMGGRIDKNINRNRGPYVYRLNGQNVHLIGSLLPSSGSSPKFTQLYIYDTDNEVSNRIIVVR